MCSNADTTTKEKRAKTVAERFGLMFSRGLSNLDCYTEPREMEIIYFG